MPNNARPVSIEATDFTFVPPDRSCPSSAPTKAGPRQSRAGLLLRSRNAGVFHDLSQPDDLGTHEALQLVDRRIINGDPRGARELGLDLGQRQHRLHLIV